MKFVSCVACKKHEITNIREDIFNYRVEILNEILRITSEIKLPSYANVETTELMKHNVKYGKGVYIL